MRSFLALSPRPGCTVAALLLCLATLAPHSTYAQPAGFDAADRAATITVYKKWNGVSDRQDDVRISLDCESGDYSGDRYINEGRPDGWEVRDIPEEGILCNVSERLQENFRPDIIDCQGLYLLPGSAEECTLVNTKIVKRIEMLNRYGLIAMILVFMAAGMLAVRRLSL